MGFRVHVVKKHEEYGGIAAFNWKTTEFKDLLSTLGCNICGEDGSDRYECLKSEYKGAIGLVKLYKDKGTSETDAAGLESIGMKESFDTGFIDFNDIDEALADTEETIGLTIDEIISTMEAFLEESDQNCDWIEFVAW